MNTEQIQGQWQIFKGKVQEQWGRLTEDEVNVAEGQLDQLAGTLSVRYGIAKEKALNSLEQIRRDACTQSRI